MGITCDMVRPTACFMYWHKSTMARVYQRWQFGYTSTSERSLLGIVVFSAYPSKLDGNVGPRAVWSAVEMITVDLLAFFVPFAGPNLDTSTPAQAGRVVTEVDNIIALAARQAEARQAEGPYCGDTHLHAESLLRERSLLRIVLLPHQKRSPVDVPLYVPGVGPGLSPNVE
jgi:hypothetical protein